MDSSKGDAGCRLCGGIRFYWLQPGNCGGDNVDINVQCDLNHSHHIASFLIQA